MARMDVGGCATHAVDHNTRLHRAEPRQQYRAARERRKTQKVNGDVKAAKGRTHLVRILAELLP